MSRRIDDVAAFVFPLSLDGRGAGERVDSKRGFALPLSPDLSSTRGERRSEELDSSGCQSD